MSTTPAAPALDRPPIVKPRGRGIQGRYLKDALARWVVWTGGLGVILALLLIFVYLLTEVMPLFRGASIEPRGAFALPGDGSATLYVAAEEQGEVGLRLAASGEATFFDLHTGAVRAQQRLPGGVAPVHLSEAAPERALVALQLADGAVTLLRHVYAVSYPGDRRLITPALEFPYGEASLPFLAAPARSFAAREEGETLLLAAAEGEGTVRLQAYERRESLLGDASVEPGPVHRFAPAVRPDLLLIEPLLSWLTVIDRAHGRLAFYRLRGDEPPELVETREAGAAIQAARYLAGGISIVAAQADGRVSQWFPARDPQGDWTLARVRDFALPGDPAAPITAIGPELRRRTFAVGDEAGRVALFHATSSRRLFDAPVLGSPVALLAFNPRAQVLLAVGRDGQARAFDVDNEHPEVSWSALWGKVWYESYEGPEWLWQSSSASADFEAKFSLTPLALGTLKAAFYAMLFAIPIAILGAIFTANFMSPELRQVVKPSVEVLAALPSVILGFLAGLWLAPFVESNLLGVFLTIVLLPLSIPVFGFLWLRLPRALRQRVPPGWEAALLLPVIAAMGWLCFAAAQPLEVLAFGGNLQGWLDREFGIGYDQRNALVVGIAMGVAVIPVIFSIAEDAIFTVPRHLSLGSLALGATPWQTLIGVVLPTASPGIFSAVMIGMGRAVGETMIVLMATGNTPVTDFSLFQGMRTFAANIAVEMPESEVGSTHFRLLFMAGLVLFLFTFCFNTLAELVRGRLRQRYGNL